MSVPLRRVLEGPSLPTSFKEGKDTEDCSPITIRKSLSFPDLTAMDDALSNEISQQSRIPVPPPLPELYKTPAPPKTIPERMQYEFLEEPGRTPKPKNLFATKPQLNVGLTELHQAKQNLKKVTLGEGGKRVPSYLKSQLPSAYVAPMVNNARRMSDGAVKTESLLKKMQKNLSQDIIPISDFPTNSIYENDEDEVEYADALDIQAMKIKEPWFFGSADRSSEENLIGRIGLDGTFLVRKSRGRDDSQPFTLTVLYEKNLFRLKIRYLPTGEYALGEKKAEEIKFPSVQALIAHYQKIPLILMGVGGGRTLLKHIPSSY